MLTRYQKRQETARRLAANLLWEYGFDVQAASERALSYCNGQRWLERLVQRELHFATRRKRKAA
jgi:hypothetical protein